MGTSATAAVAAAMKNARMRAFGKQWVVATYDEHGRVWREGNPTNFWRARAHVAESRVYFALVALGLNPEDAAYNASMFAEGDNLDWREFIREWSRLNRKENER